MKDIVATLVLGLAVVALSVELPPTYNYHWRFGIEKASKLKKLEQLTTFEDAAGQRIVGGSVTDISQTPYQVMF